MSRCIAKYVEDQVGCALPVYRSDPSRPKCQTQEEFEVMQNLSTKISMMDETELHLDTDCIPKCERDDYHHCTGKEAIFF
jgi:hypothetical protein